MAIAVLVIVLPLTLAGVPVADSMSRLTPSEFLGPTDDPQSCQCPPGDTVWLDSVLRSVMSNYPIPGMATMAIRGDSILWNRCYGYAILEESIQVTDTTCFSLASLSKPVTGTAAMQLWEDGYFDLDGDINYSLPYAVRHSHFPDSLIDYRMLMTHTSALRDNWTYIDGLHRPGDPTVSLRDFTEGYFVPGGDYYDSIANFYQWVPGLQFEYSNIGVTLLGYAIEAMTDSFPVRTRDSLFLPLGMDRTTWLFADLDTMSVACQYRWTGDQYFRYGYKSSTIFPAANLKSCTRDFARFLIAFIRDGVYDTVRILDSATVAQMTSIQFPPNVGLCWFVSELAGDSVWFHSGTWDGVCTTMGFCRKLRTGFIVFTNGHWAQVWPAVGGIVAPALHEFGRPPAAVSEARGPGVGRQSQSLVRGVLDLHGEVAVSLLDASGRTVLDLVPGANDVRALAPGVYFVREAQAQAQAQAIRKVVVTR